MAKRASPATVISHWYHLTEGLQTSPLEFYGAVEQAIATRQVPDVKTLRVDWREGGVLSAKREYLRVRRKDLIFDVCGAPFGNAFFVSWWLGERSWAATLASLPVVGILFAWLVKPGTYYKIDTALMFQESIHSAVLEVVDGLTEAKGLRTLSDLDRKPILREFYRR